MKSTPEANANKNFRPLKLFLLKKKKKKQIVNKFEELT